MCSDEPRKVDTYGVIRDGFCAVLHRVGSAAVLSSVAELYAERVAHMTTSPRNVVRVRNSNGRDLYRTGAAAEYLPG